MPKLKRGYLAELDKSEVVQRVDGIPYWRHIIDLPHGIRTPGRIGRDLIKRIHLPDDLSSRTVLDIGTFDGVCAFEAEKRHARKVVAIDTWHGTGSDDPQWWRNIHNGGAGFQLAHALLRSKVKFKELSVYDLDPSQFGKLDYVLMCGLIYHLQNPLEALKRALSVTKKLLIIESSIIRLRGLSGRAFPIAIFSRIQRQNSGLSIWWDFSVDALTDMCKSMGASKVTVKHLTWRDNSTRFVRVDGRFRFLDAPSDTARVIGNKYIKGKLSVLSRAYTLKNNVYWLRVKLGHSRNDMKNFGWIGFSNKSHLPRIQVGNTISDKRMGRVVLHVEP